MIRITAKQVAFDIHSWKLAKRTLCSGATTRLPGAVVEQGLADEQISDNNLPIYYVAIVGGGMIGMALACSLAKLPLTKQLNVAIIDSNPTLQSGHCINKEDPQIRELVLSQQHLLLSLEMWVHGSLWKSIDILTLIRCRCVVENKVFHKSLLSCLQDAGSEHKIYPLRLSSMSFEAASTSSPRGSVAKLELSDGNSLFAKLEVGADGSKSRVKELAGINSTGWKYSQNAIICTVEHMEENRCAWQRFIPNGPIALLPVGDKFRNIVWTMAPEESLNHKSLSEVDFVREINRALVNGYGPHYPRSQSFGGASAFSWLNAEKALSAPKLLN